MFCLPNVLAQNATAQVFLEPMNAIPGTLRGGGASFVPTHWSVVGACSDGSQVAAGASSAALGQLCRDYWPPLYSFARRRGYGPADAQDIVQGFFEYFLVHKGYQRADRTKGKFRSFMLASIKHYMANVWDREHALKRGGGREFVVLDAEIKTVEALYASQSGIAESDEEQLYEQRWAQTVIGCALARLSQEFAGAQKEQLLHELKPFLCGGTSLPKQADIAARLGMPIDTLRSHLLRLRVRYAELLREEVARTIGSADDVDEELRHFRKILMR